MSCWFLIPFTDQSAAKRRPAVVVSGQAYHRERPDLVIIAVTSQSRPATGIGEVTVAYWQAAGLLKPSAIKPAITTIERGLVVKRLGRLEDPDRDALRQGSTRSPADFTLTNCSSAVPV